MTKNKILATTLAAIMTIGMVSGCTSSAPASSSNASSAVDGSSTASTAGGGNEIHVASWNNAADNLKAIADQFNKLGKGTVIIDYADGDYTKLKPALQAGSGVPDIFQTQNRDIQAFYNNYGLKAFADISDIIESDVDKWAPAAIENCKAEDGKYYAIPWDIGPCALYYRTDIFEAEGIDVATLTTWDKYIEAGKKLKEKNYFVDSVPFNGTGFDNIMLFLNQLGGQYYDKDGKANLASPEMIKSFELAKKMIDAGIVKDTPNGWDDRIAAINNNELVALPYAAWYMGTMQNSCADQAGKWKVAPLPAFEEGGNNTANIGGSILAVSAQCKDIELAKAFLVYAMKDNEGNDINMKFGEFPSYSPAYETEFFKSSNPYYCDQTTGVIFSDLTGAPYTAFGSYFTDVTESMKTATGQIFSSGMDPKTALEAATKDAQAKIDIK